MFENLQITANKLVSMQRVVNVIAVVNVTLHITSKMMVGRNRLCDGDTFAENAITK